ncbi:hypothetical protein D9M71_420640 [compost metagenome]
MGSSGSSSSLTMYFMCRQRLVRTGTSNVWLPWAGTVNQVLDSPEASFTSLRWMV